MVTVVTKSENYMGSEVEIGGLSLRNYEIELCAVFEENILCTGNV